MKQLHLEEGDKTANEENNTSANQVKQNLLSPNHNEAGSSSSNHNQAGSPSSNENEANNVSSNQGPARRRQPSYTQQESPPIYDLFALTVC